ncbi:hypothetical protein FOCC_FOCC010821 [Frankliniella occidentalis]|nr:hypothetical protein FOCC_FOCC010821 [Frankliniella occidentalis]
MTTIHAALLKTIITKVASWTARRCTLRLLWQLVFWCCCWSSFAAAAALAALATDGADKVLCTTIKEWSFSSFLLLTIKLKYDLAYCVYFAGMTVASLTMTCVVLPGNAPAYQPSSVQYHPAQYPPQPSSNPYLAPAASAPAYPTLPKV